MGTLSLTKEARIYNGTKNLFNKWGGKTRRLHVKAEIRTFPNTIHKNKLKMD